MPLFEPARVREIRGEMDRRQYAILPEVDLPQRYFRLPAKGSADILLRPLADGSGCIVLMEEGVEYLDTREDLRECFAHRAANGWRPLMVLTPGTPEAVLRQVDLLLGLTGAEPQVPVQPATRELTAPAPEPEAKPADHAERFGADLVAQARRGRLPQALFRGAETASTIRILSKQGKNAVCLVGEAGVGKTAVVEQLAIEIASGEVPPSLRAARILDVNLSYVAAGAVHQNEFEGRLKEIIEMARADARVILFFDELHTICRQGSDASQMVKSDLGRGRIHCIGATTPTEFRAIEADAALARRFQVVRVNELSRDQTLTVLEQSCARLEQHHQVRLSPEMLAAAVDLSVRYTPHRRLPDKALDLLDEACASARLRAGHHDLLEGRER